MNAISKLFFLLLTALLLASCSPAEVDKAAARIADFTPPAGFTAEYALDVADYSVVAYNGGDGHSHLFLAQAPADADIDQAGLEEAIDNAVPGKPDRTTRLAVVETRPVTIRGKETSLVISEGSSSDGSVYYQAAAMFEGKSGGVALVLLNKPADSFNADEVEEFVNSIE